LIEAGVSEAGVSVAAAEGQRLHPIGLFVGFVTVLPRLFFPIIAGFFGSQKAGLSLYAPLIILAIICISLLYRWIDWLRFRYYLDADDIRIESGVFDRNARSIPYDRIQDVSIQQKLLPRLLGLSEVKFETGGGKGDEAKLSYVSTADAERLREVVRAHKSGVANIGAATEVAPEAGATDQPPIYAMDTKRLVILGIYSFSLIIFAILFGVAQQFDFLLPFDFWDIRGWFEIAKERGMPIEAVGRSVQIFGVLAGLFALIILGTLSGIVKTVLRDFGFRLDRSEKGFRRRRGLLTLTDVVMPIHRVQAITILTGPIRKRSGWYALKFISLANDADAEKQEKDHVVAPLATLEEVWTIAREAGVEPPATDLKFTPSHVAAWLDGYLILLVLAAMGALGLAVFTPAGSSAGLLLLASLPLAPFLWFGWRNSRSAMDEDQLFVRQGWWRERMTIAAQAKVQSVEISQGPLAKLRGLATLQFGLSGGDLVIKTIPLATAKAIRDGVLERVVAVDYSALNAKN
jgi:putative membrane protein